MAVKPVPKNDLFNGLNFDGIDSRDYGVYISGPAVYNAPERDVEEIEIPGRNGSYMLDKGRFRNIAVTYPAGLAGGTESDFAQGIRAFRNAIASKKGYCKLTDDYNPNEYRMAVYASGLDVEVIARRAGKFDIVFNAKPQRFLLSGEVPVILGGSVKNEKTVSGSIVTIESDGGDAVTSLVAQITPTQAGSGDPSPTNVRAITGWTACNVNVAGKNLLTFNNRSGSAGGIQYVIDSGIVSLDGQPAGNVFNTNLTTNFHLPAGNYVLTGCPSGGGSTSYEILLRTNKASRRDYGSGVAFTIVEDETVQYIQIVIRANTDASGLVFYPMIRLASETDDTYEPYHGKTYPVSFGSAGTVYGGTVDVVTGVLTVTHKAVDLGTLNWTKGNDATGVYFRTYISDIKQPQSQSALVSAICTNYKAAPVNNVVNNSFACAANSTQFFVRDLRYSDAAAFKSAVSGVKLVYELATPQTYNLTPQEVELLVGQNNVWADTGDVTLTYGADPDKLFNPTLFEASPLLIADGNGTIKINDDEIVISRTPYGYQKVKGYGGSAYYTSLISSVLQLNKIYANGDPIRLETHGTSSAYSVAVYVQLPVASTRTYYITASSLSSKSGIISTATMFQENMTAGYPLEVRLDARNEIAFVAGTASTVTGSAAFTIKYSDNGGAIASSTVTVNVTVSYDGDKTITITTTTTSSPGLGSVAYKRYYGDVSVVSSLYVGDALYLDLDIGEAYTYDDGVLVSLNNNVYIPAQLPTLKAGANAFDYDSTITSLKVVPRWWEV